MKRPDTLSSRKPKRKCNCDACNGMTPDEMQRREDRWMAEHGWFAQAVDGDNIHTHGISESFGHPDLMMTWACFPKDVNHAHNLFRQMVSNIRTGYRYTIGQSFTWGIREGTSQHVHVNVTAGKESGRDVLKLVVIK